MRNVLEGVVRIGVAKARRKPDEVDKVVNFLSTGDLSGIAPGSVNEFRLGGVLETGEETSQPVLQMGPDTNAFLTPTIVRRKGFFGRKATVVAIASPASPLQDPNIRKPRKSFFFEPEPENKVDRDMVVIVDISALVPAHQSIRAVAGQARMQLHNQFPFEERALVHRPNGNQSES